MAGRQILSNSRGKIRAKVVISCHGEIEEFIVEVPSKKFVEVFTEFFKEYSCAMPE